MATREDEDTELKSLSNPFTDMGYVSNGSPCNGGSWGPLDEANALPLYSGITNTFNTSRELTVNEVMTVENKMKCPSELIPEPGATDTCELRFFGAVGRTAGIVAKPTFSSAKRRIYVQGAPPDSKDWIDVGADETSYSSDAPGAVILKAPRVMEKSVTFRLPGADGAKDEVIQTDGQGNLSFGSPLWTPLGDDVWYNPGNVYIANELYLRKKTAGSVLFIGADGQMKEDNANLFWDDSSARLGIGTNTPARTLDVVATESINLLANESDPSSYAYNFLGGMSSYTEIRDDPNSVTGWLDINPTWYWLQYWEALSPTTSQGSSVELLHAPSYPENVILDLRGWGGDVRIESRETDNTAVKGAFRLNMDGTSTWIPTVSASITSPTINLAGTVVHTLESATAAGGETAYSLTFNHNKTVDGQGDMLYGSSLTVQTPAGNSSDTTNILIGSGSAAYHSGAGAIGSLLGFEASAFNFAGSAVDSIYGIGGYAYNNAGACGEVAGMIFKAGSLAESGAAVSVTNVRALYVGCYSYGYGAGSDLTIGDVDVISTGLSSLAELSSGTLQITNWREIYLPNILFEGGTPSITNHYGLYVEEPTRGSALNYPIYVVGGSSRLGDNVAVDDYYNFGTTFGTTGYGLRQNAGAVEYKDSGGAWTALNGLGGGGAPTNATYLVQTADGTLSNEQAMGSLATGLVKNTTTTGVQLIATLGKDYGLNCWMHDAFAGIEGTVIGQGVYTECGSWADDTLSAGSTATATGGVLTLSNNADAASTISYISTTFTTSTGLNGGGRIHFKMRINQNATGYAGGLYIYDADVNKPWQIYFRYSTTWQIAVWNGAGVKIQDANKDQWYTIDVFWGPTGNTAGPITIFIDGAWAYKYTLGTFSSLWNKLRIYSQSAAGGADCAFDIDDLYVYSAMPLFGV